MEILIYLIIGYLGYKAYKHFTGQKQRAQQLEHTAQVKKEMYKQDLQKSAMVGAAGGLAALFFINQLQNQNNLDQQTVEQMEQMDLEQLQQLALDQQLMDQQQMDELMNQMHDPYQNPGLDSLIDESYHGINHGLGIADHDHYDDYYDYGYDDHHSDFSDFGGGHDTF